MRGPRMHRTKHQCNRVGCAGYDQNIESGFKRKRGDRARRNRQFTVIAAKRRKFETADLPIISIDGN